MHKQLKIELKKHCDREYKKPFDIYHYNCANKNCFLNCFCEYDDKTINGTKCRFENFPKDWKIEGGNDE